MRRLGMDHHHGSYGPWWIGNQMSEEKAEKKRKEKIWEVIESLIWLWFQRWYPEINNDDDWRRLGRAMAMTTVKWQRQRYQKPTVPKTAMTPTKWSSTMTPRYQIKSINQNRLRYGQCAKPPHLELCACRPPGYRIILAILLLPLSARWLLSDVPSTSLGVITNRLSMWCVLTMMVYSWLHGHGQFLLLSSSLIYRSLPSHQPSQ